MSTIFDFLVTLIVLALFFLALVLGSWLGHDLVLGSWLGHDLVRRVIAHHTFHCLIV